MNTTWQERKAQRQKETALEHAKYLNAKYAPTQDEWNAHWSKMFQDHKDGKFKFSLGDLCDGQKEPKRTQAPKIECN